VDTLNNLYVTDSGNDTIRKLISSGTNWLVSTIGGSSTNAGFGDGTGSAAQFANPTGIAVNSLGNLFIDAGSGGPSDVRAGVVSVQGLGGQGAGNMTYNVEILPFPSPATLDGAAWAIQGAGYWVSGIPIGVGESTINVPITLLFSNISGWTLPSGQVTPGIYPVSGTQTTLTIVNLTYQPAPPVLLLTAGKGLTNGLWLCGASNATYEVDWARNMTNVTWPQWALYGTYTLSQEATQHVATWQVLTQASPTANQGYYRAEWINAQQ
jgi:hypothetical protein